MIMFSYIMLFLIVLGYASDEEHEAHGNTMREDMDLDRRINTPPSGLSS